MPYWSLIGLDESNPFFVFTTSDHNWMIIFMIYGWFTRWLPYFLNIHPQIWQQNYVGFICLGFFIYFSFVLTQTLTLHCKKSFWQPLLALLTAPFILIAMRFASFDFILSNDCWFYSYILPCLFMFLTLNIAQKHYIKNENLSKREIVDMCLLIILIALSHEFHRFVLLSSTLFIFLLHKFLIKTPVNTKKSIFIYLGLVVANTALCLTNIFQNWFEQTLYDDKGFFIYAFNYFADTTKYFLTEYKIIFGLIVLSLILIAFLTKKQDENKRFFVFITGLFISVILFNYLIFIGKSAYGGMLMFNHQGIKFTTAIYMYYILISACGYLITNLNTTRSKIISSIFSVVIITTMSVKKENFQFGFVEYISTQIKELSYIMEKFHLMYGRNHNEFYNYFDRSTFNRYATFYLEKTYGSHGNSQKVIEVCKEEDGLDYCREKMLEKVKEKTGYEFSEEELKKHDFSTLEEINTSLIKD